MDLLPYCSGRFLGKMTYSDVKLTPMGASPRVCGCSSSLSSASALTGRRSEGVPTDAIAG
jgi:hypothetical protein